jgi:hypothetical protein
LLLPINRHHRHDPAPGLQVKLKGGMALHQSDNQFTAITKATSTPSDPGPVKKGSQRTIPPNRISKT